MKKPTGKLAFAYETIRNLEDKLKVAESMHIDDVRHVWESRNCGSCTELAEHHDRLKAQNAELVAHIADIKDAVEILRQSKAGHDRAISWMRLNGAVKWCC